MVDCPAMAARLRIGISGWTYTPWRKVFYPEGLAHKRELEYASRQLNSIEINGSFYSLQRPDSYRTWYEQTPRDFVFSMKGGRFITHMKKLKDVEGPLANYFGSGVLALREKMGPILWQFPPNFGFDRDRFSAFFDLLPRITEQAAELARGHDRKLKHGAVTEVDRRRRIRYAVEVRHPSFLAPEFVALLRKHNIAFCFADSGGKWPYTEDLTSDFVYVRLHGPEELYVSGYTDTGLHWWAERSRAWTAGAEPADARHVSQTPAKRRKSRDVYVYFDNDAKVKAPFDAIRLRERLGQRETE